MKQIWGPISLVISAAILGSYGIIIKVLSQELGINSQIIFRYILALILFLCTIFVTRTKLRLPPQFIFPLLVYGLLMQVDIWLFTRAALIIPISSLLGGFYAGMILMGTLVGVAYFHERFYIPQFISTILSILGLYALVLYGGVNSGILLAVAAGLFECIANMFRKKLPLSKGVISLATMISILVFTLIQIAISHESLSFPILPATWMTGIIFGFLALIVNVALTHGFRFTPMNLGSIILSGEIIFGALFSWILLSIRPTNTEVIASLCVILSIAAQNIKLNPKGRTILFIRNILET